MKFEIKCQVNAQNKMVFVEVVAAEHKAACQIARQSIMKSGFPGCIIVSWRAVAE